jgi:hypothetical protein
MTIIFFNKKYFKLLLHERPDQEKLINTDISVLGKRNDANV